MGRLDDAAKRKVVELRKAGLSFRKIKAVLELDNIKVSAQAIYLFLKEFQGKQGKVGPEEGGSSTVPQVIAGAGGGRGWRREGWSEQQIRNLLRESSSHAGHAAATEFAKQGGPTSEARAQPSGSGQISGGSSSLQQQEGEKEDKDIQIISVTSLAQNTQQRGPQSPGTEAGTGSGAPAVTVTGSYMRRRVTPSPAANPMLAARKRLLDKALSHRAKTRESSLQSYQQMASLLRRDQSNVPASDVTRAVPGQPQFDLTTQNRLNQARRSMDGQPGASVPRRMFQQRAGLAVRSAHPPPCVGIRLPNPAVPPTSQVSGPVIRLQTPSSQGLLRRDGNPSPQQVPQEAGGRSGGGGGGLQEQVQSLGSEVHSLSLAVRMLVEQQCRLEREQAQQTQVQKQILSTLQSMASRLGPCNSLQQHTKTPPPLSLPASTSYNQDTFTYSQGTYAQCSQTQPSYNEMGSPSLETMEAFKLTGLNTHGINGFQSCSSANSLPLTHTPTHTLAHTQSYTPAYTQQHAPTHIPSYTQSYAPTYTQSHTHTYRGTESKAPDYPSPSTEGALQDCSASTQMSVNPASPLTISPQDPQLNIIKVETL